MVDIEKISSHLRNYGGRRPVSPKIRTSVSAKRGARIKKSQCAKILGINDQSVLEKERLQGIVKPTDLDEGDIVEVTFTDIYDTRYREYYVVKDGGFLLFMLMMSR